MEKINNFFDRIASPLSGLANWLLRLGLGIAFFLTWIWEASYIRGIRGLVSLLKACLWQKLLPI